MITVNHLTKRYGSHLAVDDISFTVQDGEIVGFLGPNGAGKSTTMNMLTGYISSSSGEALINDINILDNPIQAKREIGYLPELPPLYQEMTVMGYLRFVYDLKKCKLPRKAHLTEICNLCKISDVQDRIIKNLSKGYRQRVGLAQALINNPPILILDEPTAGLDPAGRENLMANIRDYHRNKGKTIILVSHSMDEIAQNVDRILVLKSAHVLMQGTPAEVFARGEELLSAGLDVPQITRIAMELKRRGVDIDPAVYTVEALERQLLALRKGGAGC